MGVANVVQGIIMKNLVRQFSKHRSVRASRMHGTNAGESESGGDGAMKTSSVFSWKKTFQPLESFSARIPKPNPGYLLISIFDFNFLFLNSSFAAQNVYWRSWGGKGGNWTQNDG